MMIFVWIAPTDDIGVASIFPQGIGMLLSSFQPRASTSFVHSLGCRPRLAGLAKYLAFRQNGSNVTLFITGMTVTNTQNCLGKIHD